MKVEKRDNETFLYSISYEIYKVHLHRNYMNGDTDTSWSNITGAWKINKECVVHIVVYACMHNNVHMDMCVHIIL